MMQGPEKPLQSEASLAQRVRSAAALVMAGVATAAILGAILGIHNGRTSFPGGLPGALAGAVLGALAGSILAVIVPRQGRLWARVLGSLAFGALLGLEFGLRIPTWRIPPGPLAAGIGAGLAAVVLVCLRSRLALGLLAGVWVIGLAGPETPLPNPAHPPSAPVSGYEIEPRRPARIPPGAIIPDGKPPEGWSALILKARCQVSKGDVNRLPSAATHAVATLFNAIVANVQSEADKGDSQRYRLTAVATGIGTRIGGQDVIITPATQERLGAKLDLVTRMTLQRHQQRAARGRLAVWSSTMAVLDDPTFMLQEGKHRPVILRFAILVQPATGKLDTLVWYIQGSAAEGYEGAVGPLQWLAPGQMDLSELHVDAREFTFGLPQKESALALTALPQGRRQIPLLPALVDVAAKVPLTAEEAATLERLLRQALAR